MNVNHVYFFTGFPGFLATRLIKGLIHKDELFEKAFLLVLPALEDKAKQEAQRLEQELKLDSGTLQVVVGDITKMNLDLTQTVNHEQITHVFHLAAIYDLAVPKDIAYTVNVTGTKNVNNWILTLPNIQRYIYFSTAYVAGTREGALLETELIKPPSFKNYYEETKYEAEVLVEALKPQVPTTIIRPGIVKGHSVTGETVKFDGPYFILNTLRAIGFLPIKPYIGKSTSKINLVPVDFIIEAVSFLALYEQGAGKTYHLTDPNPYSATEIYEMLVQEMYHVRPKGIIPISWCKAFLALAPIRKFLHTEQETIDYFTWKGNFDCRQAKEDLMKANIACPDFKAGVPAMVQYYKLNENNPNYQVQIR
ncbi:SDR family oxidoreductase [Bacillus massiliigorillae]|uniref:SDR family oxidoreductase n=1 Tax=Bacillus massiliigorillae TaxID=1243664 RepID=UPI00039BF58F|nr:SDR family oxidoreductase [Bacillus massiliigorillae]